MKYLILAILLSSCANQPHNNPFLQIKPSPVSGGALSHKPCNQNSLGQAVPATAPNTCTTGAP